MELTESTNSIFFFEDGSVDLVLCSPPCQSYSGSSRDVDHNSEEDLYRKDLSLKFFDAMQVTGALVGRVVHSVPLLDLFLLHGRDGNHIEEDLTSIYFMLLLVGVFENVEGMWRRPNIYFFKKICMDHIRAGYQVRTRLLRAHKFGDPQGTYSVNMWLRIAPQSLHIV